MQSFEVIMHLQSLVVLCGPKVGNLHLNQTSSRFYFIDTCMVECCI